MTFVEAAIDAEEGDIDGIGSRPARSSTAAAACRSIAPCRPPRYIHGILWQRGLMFARPLPAHSSVTRKRLFRKRLDFVERQFHRLATQPVMLNVPSAARHIGNVEMVEQVVQPVGVTSWRRASSRIPWLRLASSHFLPQVWPLDAGGVVPCSGRGRLAAMDLVLSSEASSRQASKAGEARKQLRRPLSAQGVRREREHFALALGRVQPQKRQLRILLFQHIAASPDLDHKRAGGRQVIARLGEDAAHQVETVGPARVRKGRLGGILGRERGQRSAST